MSLIGLMTIEFNQNVNAKLDQLDLVFDQFSDEDKIELSYKFVMVQDKVIQLQIIFDKPLLVSQGSDDDKLTIYMPIIIDAEEDSTGRRLEVDVQYFKVELTIPM